MPRRTLARTARILGIDPGISSCGWCTGVFSYSGACLEIAAGVIRTKADKKSGYYVTVDDQRRALHVLEDLLVIIKDFKPTVVAVETPIGGARNAQSVKFIGMSSMLIATLMYHHPNVNRYSPYEMKEVFTGNKKAQKEDMIARAEELHPGLISKLLKTEQEHAADATAALHMELT